MALIMSNEAIFYSITGKKNELVLGRNANMSSPFQSQAIFTVHTYIDPVNSDLFSKKLVHLS
jgi:hypothetical protein